MTQTLRSSKPSKGSLKPLTAAWPRALLALGTLTAVITLFALGACSSVPRDNARLDEARSSLRSAMVMPQTGSLAGTEVKQASDALALAEAAQMRGDSVATVDHLSYLALQRSSIVQEAANRKATELAVAEANAARDKLRLEARTQEADLAQRQAMVAQRDAQSAQRDAQASQRDAQTAQREAEAARRAAQDAQRGTVAAQQQSAASQQQALEAERLAAELRAQLAALDAKKTERGMVITMGDVLFDTGRAELRRGGMRNVEKLGGFLKTYPQRTVMIEGFTDSVGGDAQNQTLSARRADAVRAALQSLGVGTERLATRGYGESFPVAANDSASGRQLNRRVEIVLSDEAGLITPR